MKKYYLFLLGIILLIPLISSAFTVGNFTIFPDGVGTNTQWNVVGRAQNWQAVSETVYNKSDYVWINLVVKNDTYTVQNITLPTNAKITNITVYANATRYTTSNRSYMIAIYTNEFLYNGSIFLTGIAGRTRNSTSWTTNPNTTANWTQTQINNLEIGVKASINASGAGSNISQMYADVWYMIQNINWSTNSTNSTYEGQLVEHRVFWTDDVNLSGYIFSFDNGTGTFSNDSWVSMIGTANWSNVSKVVNSTEGSTIKWIVYANDSADNWNVTDTFQYLTTVAPVDSCTCTNSSSWTIINGDQCTLSTACNLDTGILRIMDGTLRIDSSGFFECPRMLY